jgi:hypothetical protein
MPSLPTRAVIALTIAAQIVATLALRASNGLATAGYVALVIVGCGLTFWSMGPTLHRVVRLGEAVAPGRRSAASRPSPAPPSTCPTATSERRHRRRPNDETCGAMDDAAAGWCVAGGLAAIGGGLLLLKVDDAFLFPLWGVAFLVGGTVATVVGVGVLLRLWR